MYKYTIRELENNKNYTIFIENKQEHKKLKDTKLNICDYMGSHCYDHTKGEYSSSSSRNNPGYYENRTIIYFNQIDFEDNPLNNLEIW